MNDQPEPGAEQTPGVGDLPYVDGKAATADELRAEVAKETDPHVEQIEELRGDIAATVEELGSRLDPRTQIPQFVVRQRPVFIAAATLLVVLVLWRRRSSRRHCQNQRVRDRDGWRRSR